MPVPLRSGPHCANSLPRVPSPRTRHSSSDLRVVAILPWLVASGSEAAGARAALHRLRIRHGTLGEAASNLALAIAGRLPRPLAYRAAGTLGRLRYRRQRRRLPVRPELARLATDEAQLELWKRRQCEERSYAALELERSLRAGRPAAAPIRFMGLAHLDAAIAEGTGALLYTFHLAGLMTLLSGLARLGYPLVAIRAGDEGFADESRLARLKRDATRSEQALGCRLLWMGQGNVTAGALATKALRRGEAVVAVTDMPLSRPSVEVELLGSRTVLSGGFATLAEASGAPLLDMFCHRAGRPYPLIASIGPPLNASDGVAATVQRCATRLEAHLERHPEVWIATPIAEFMNPAPALTAAA